MRHKQTTNSRGKLTCPACKREISLRAFLFSLGPWLKCGNCDQLLVGNRFINLLAAIYNLLLVTGLAVLFWLAPESVSIHLWSLFAIVALLLLSVFLVWRFGSYKTLASDNGDSDFKLDTPAEQNAAEQPASRSAVKNK